MSVGAVVGIVVLLEGLLVLAAVLRLVRGLRSTPAFAPTVVSPIPAPGHSASRDSLPGPRDGDQTEALRAAS